MYIYDNDELDEKCNLIHNTIQGFFVFAIAYSTTQKHFPPDFLCNKTDSSLVFFMSPPRIEILLVFDFSPNAPLSLLPLPEPLAISVAIRFFSATAT